MSSTSENETEILLGNRHLLAIFFVLAVLLGIAFTGGYMVGRNTAEKKPAVSTATAGDPAASTAATSLETHALPPANDNGEQSASDQTRTVQPPPADTTPQPVKEEPPLGTPKKEAAATTTDQEQQQSPEKPAAARVKPAAAPTAFTGPQSGQTFLQVAAVGHTEANALADVLSKKGFHAHAVAKPGSSDVYRVLIGPMQDTSELSSTRESLRNAGFTKIFVQRY